MQTFDIKGVQVQHFLEAQKELICHTESQHTFASQKGNGRFLEWVHNTILALQHNKT